MSSSFSGCFVSLLLYVISCEISGFAAASLSYSALCVVARRRLVGLPRFGRAYLFHLQGSMSKKLLSYSVFCTVPVALVYICCYSFRNTSPEISVCKFHLVYFSAIRLSLCCSRFFLGGWGVGEFPLCMKQNIIVYMLATQMRRIILRPVLQHIASFVPFIYSRLLCLLQGCCVGRNSN